MVLREPLYLAILPLLYNSFILSVPSELSDISEYPSIHPTSVPLLMPVSSPEIPLPSFISKTLESSTCPSK